LDTRQNQGFGFGFPQNRSFGFKTDPALVLLATSMQATHIWHETIFWQQTKATGKTVINPFLCTACEINITNRYN